jgi:hypothetical protein
MKSELTPMHFTAPLKYLCIFLSLNLCFFFVKYKAHKKVVAA